MKKYVTFTLLLVALSACLIWTDSLFATERQKKSLLYLPYNPKLKYPDYKSDLQQLKFFDPSQEGAYSGPDRLDRFEKKANILLKKWLKKDILIYYELTWKVCAILSSTDLSDDLIREDKLDVKYAMCALKKSREKNAVEMPLDTEIRLLGMTIIEPEYREGSLKGEDWARHRSEKMQFFVHAFKRIEKEIDEDYDFSVQFASHPSPPHGVGAWVSGMGAEAIKDPKLRAEYEKRVAEHSRKIAECNRQRFLRSSRGRLNRLIEYYTTRAYLKPPYRTSELKAYLQKYVKDQKVRERILKKYAEGLKRESQNQ